MMVNSMHQIKLMHTGIPNLDEILGGGVPVYSLNILAGQPGTGKTILTQQMLFNYVHQHPHANVLYLVTLSEPSVKVVRYMQFFSFFDAEVFSERVHYQDIGVFVRKQAFDDISDYILDLVEEHHPELLVIDSFRAIRDLSDEVGEFRRFCYDLSVRLTGARCTTFLVGEYDRPSIAEGVEFAIADGIIYLEMDYHENEDHRSLQVYKLRGCPTEMTPFPFKITKNGIHVFSTELLLRLQKQEPISGTILQSGILRLDALLCGGFPCGHSIVLSGSSGTGKTIFALQFLVHGAKRGERGVLFSFEETPERLRYLADSFGWNLRELEEQNLICIVFIPQTAIRIEENLEHIVTTMSTFKPHRFVIDSLSVFLHKMSNSALQRQKVSQLATFIRQTGVVGILISDIPSSNIQQITRFGIEETIVDGVIILSSNLSNMKRRRYLEVFKMRTINHITGQHRIQITSDDGIEVLYHEGKPQKANEVPPPLIFEPLRHIVRGTLRHCLSWLVQGELGVGKSTLCYQFATEGLKRKESVLFIAADMPAHQVRQDMQSFGFLPDPYIELGQLVIVDGNMSHEQSLDMSDPEAFLFTIMRQVECMNRPLRIIFDSLLPQGAGYSSDAFVHLIHRKNRLLRQSGVTLFDTLLQNTLELSNLHNLLNAFDVILELYTPNWGEMGIARSSGHRVIQVRKAPTSIDLRPFPYNIADGIGIVVQNEFYQQHR